MRSMRQAVASPFSWAVVVLVAVYAAPGFFRPIADPDVWWLLWSGNRLLEGHVQVTNGLSWLEPDMPWTLHEPLVALTYAAVGVEHIGLVRGTVLSLLTLSMVRLARVESAWASVGSLVWVLPGISLALSARPMAWGLVLLAVTLLVVRSTHRVAGPALVALAALWANVHGSFPLGLVVIAVHRPRWVVPAAVGTLLNPYGWGLHVLVARYALGSDALALSQSYIVEWRPLWPRDLQTTVQLLTLLAGLAVTLHGRRRREMVLGVLVTLLALKHARFAAPAMLALLPSIARWLAARVPRRPLPSPQPLAVLVLALVALVSPRPEPVLGTPQASARLRTWSDIELGAWLGHHGIAPYWDARNDCYSELVLADGVRVALQLDGWLEVLERHGIEQVVTQSPALVEALRAEGWSASGSPAVLVAPQPDG
ncbi:MAG: hypothetical protein GY884_30890 [Proteobacteria bacterium]|nr:hypothetical protein [Pseudomonadota bacterium]